MGNHEHPVYITETEAEALLGLLACDSADEAGHEQSQGWANIMQQLYRILND